MENLKGISDKNIKKIDLKEIKSKKKQNQICFFQKKAQGIDIIKNIIYSLTSQNYKSFNLNLESLEMHEQSYYGDKYIQNLINESTDHV